MKAKILLHRETNGFTTMIMECEKTEENCRSVEAGTPSPEIKQWAVEYLRVLKDKARIIMSDGTHMQVDKRRKRLIVTAKGRVLHLHRTVFNSIGWKLTVAGKNI